MKLAKRTRDSSCEKDPRLPVQKKTKKKETGHWFYHKNSKGKVLRCGREGCSWEKKRRISKKVTAQKKKVRSTERPVPFFYSPKGGRTSENREKPIGGGGKSAGEKKGIDKKTNKKRSKARAMAH